VYDKLLTPRQSFRITLYTYPDINIKHPEDRLYETPKELQPYDVNGKGK